MRIGFDVDGPLADFSTAYRDLTVKVTGKNLFHIGDGEDPPVWVFPEHRGYTRGEMDRVWLAINESDTFWVTLDMTTFGLEARDRILELRQQGHDVYFITNRSGKLAKAQTEAWLCGHKFSWSPTVLLTPHKGFAAWTLSLDCYIDDLGHNVDHVLHATNHRTRAYLLNRRLNADHVFHPSCPVRRVNTVMEFLHAEQLA